MRSKIQLARALALASTASLCLVEGAFAQQTAAVPGVPEQVVITGRLEEDLPARLAELGTRVVTVDAAQIQNGGYVDVGQSLQTLVPGLYVAQKNGPFDYVTCLFRAHAPRTFCGRLTASASIIAFMPERLLSTRCRRA